MNNFWNRTSAPPLSLSTPSSEIGVGSLSMSALLSPSAPLSATTAVSAGRTAADLGKYGRLPGGVCTRCFDAVCGGVDPSNGRPLPPRKCADGETVRCYFDSFDECNKPYPQRQALASTLSTKPMGQLMKTVYEQPSYSDAAQTFFNGYN